MTTISVPINVKQAEFIDSLVKRNFATNKADAVRKAIDLLAEEEAVASVLRGEQDLLEGRVFRGNLRKILNKFK